MDQLLTKRQKRKKEQLGVRLLVEAGALKTMRFTRGRFPYWGFSHDITKNSNYKTIDPPEIILS